MNVDDRILIPFRVIRPIAQSGETVAGQTIENNLRGNLWLAELDGANFEGKPQPQIVVCSDGWKPDREFTLQPIFRSSSD